MSPLSISKSVKSVPYAGIDPIIEQDRKEFEEKITLVAGSIKLPIPTNWEAYTPLQRAAALGQLDICRKLKEAGCQDLDQGEIDPKVNGLAAIILGIFFNYDEILRFLFTDSPNKTMILHSILAIEAPIFTELWGMLSNKEQQDFVNLMMHMKDWRIHLPKLFELTTIHFQNQIIRRFVIDDSYEIDLFKQLWSKAPPEVKNYINEDGKSWMYLAIIMRRKEVLDYLIDEVSEINFNFQCILSTPLALVRGKANEWGQPLIDKMALKDNGFTDDIERCIIFGHRLSLKGVFEGFDGKRLRILSDQIIGSLKRTSKSYECNAFLPSRILQIEEAFELAHSEPEAAFERSFIHCTFVHCGWSGHRANSVFKDRVLVKIDTGTGISRGLRFYHIKNTDQAARKAAMTTLFNNNKNLVDKEIGSLYFHQTIDRELDLESFAWLEIEQKVGNCAWSASKATLLAIMILQEANENNDLLDKDKIQNAYDFVKHPYNFWEKVDDIKDFITPLKIIERYPGIFDLQNIIDEIILNALEDGKDLHIMNVLFYNQKLVNWQHPQTKKSLIRCCYEKKMLCNFAYLLGRASKDIRDIHGKTLSDDYKDNPPTPKDSKFFREFILKIAINAGIISKETFLNVSEKAFDAYASKYEKALIVYTPSQTPAEFIQSNAERAIQEVFRRAMELEKAFHRLTKTI